MGEAAQKLSAKAARRAVSRPNRAFWRVQRWKVRLSVEAASSADEPTRGSCRAQRMVIPSKRPDIGRAEPARARQCRFAIGSQGFGPERSRSCHKKSARLLIG